MRKGDSTSYLRMDAMNEDTINHYFDLLEDTLKEHDLLNSPSQLYNVDESGIPSDLKAPKVVTVKGTKKVQYQSPGRKGQITIVACGNAAGQVLPPLVIYDSKSVRAAWTRHEVYLGQNMVQVTMVGSVWNSLRVGSLNCFYLTQLLLALCCFCSMGIARIINWK